MLISSLTFITEYSHRPAWTYIRAFRRLHSHSDGFLCVNMTRGQLNTQFFTLHFTLHSSSQNGCGRQLVTDFLFPVVGALGRGAALYGSGGKHTPGSSNKGSLENLFPIREKI